MGKRFLTSILAMTLGVAMLSACGKETSVDTADTKQESADTDESAQEKVDQSAYPIEIETAFGTVTIDEKPERIATVGWANHDIPIALGVTPVGVSKANYGLLDDNGLLFWSNDGLKAIGEEEPVVFDDVDGIDFEAVAAVEPDVILAAYSGITQEEYDTLSQIAPVVAYESQPWATDWRTMTRLDSKGMGMEAEGEALISEVEAFIDEQTAQYPDMEGKTAAFVYFDPTDLGSFYVYTSLDPRALFLNDLGLTIPEEVKAIDDGTSFTISISSENIDLLKNLDLIITYGDDTTLAALQADSLVSQVPAVANGAVVVMDNNSAIAASCTPSPLSIKATLPEYLEMINQALSNAK